jgi:hypothetical protein
LKVCECAYSVFFLWFSMYSLLISKYFNAFERFLVYMKVLIVYLNVHECSYSIFMVYFNASIMYLKAFGCT